MNKKFHYILLLLVAALSLAGCEKDEPNFDIKSKYNIVFDDAIDKASGSYKKDSPFALKISTTGNPTNIRVISSYSVRVNNANQARTKDLGSFPVSNGTVTLNFPTANLRNTTDGPIVGSAAGGNDAAGTSAALNTYQLRVDAVGADGTSERRFFSALVTQ